MCMVPSLLGGAGRLGIGPVAAAVARIYPRPHPHPFISPPLLRSYLRPERRPQPPPRPSPPPTCRNHQPDPALLPPSQLSPLPPRGPRRQPPTRDDQPVAPASSLPSLPHPRSMRAGARHNGHACRLPHDTGGPGLRPPARGVDLRHRPPPPEHRRRCPPPPPPSESRRPSRARALAHPSRYLLLESAAAHCGGGLSGSRRQVRRAGPAPLAAPLSCFGGVSD